MRQVIVNGQPLNLFEVKGEPHGFVGLYVGHERSQQRISVPRSWWESDSQAAIRTSGAHIRKGEA